MATRSIDGKRQGKPRPAPADAVVAVGVSRSSYDSLKMVFSRLATDTGAAFVVVFSQAENLVPAAIAKDLARLSGLPAKVCARRLRPQANSIYVAPVGSVVDTSIICTLALMK